MAIDSCNGHKLYFPASFHWKWKITHLAHWCQTAKLSVRLVVSLLKPLWRLCPLLKFYQIWYICSQGVAKGDQWHLCACSLSWCYPLLNGGGGGAGEDRNFTFLLWFIPINSGKITDTIFLTLVIHSLRSLDVLRHQEHAYEPNLWSNSSFTLVMVF